jgi:hypothetical protein
VSRGSVLFGGEERPDRVGELLPFGVVAITKHGFRRVDAPLPGSLEWNHQTGGTELLDKYRMDALLSSGMRRAEYVDTRYASVTVAEAMVSLMLVYKLLLALVTLLDW